MGLIQAAKAKTIEEIVGIIQGSILNPITGLFFVIATLVFLWGVVEFIAGASNEEARTKGKQHMVWGLLGMLIMLSAKAIIAVLDKFFKQIS